MDPGGESSPPAGHAIQSKLVLPGVLRVPGASYSRLDRTVPAGYRWQTSFSAEGDSCANPSCSVAANISLDRVRHTGSSIRLG